MFKIISGGQTGVDRAALDVAIDLNIPHGGYCCKFRKSEDGSIPLKYNLIELDSPEYRVRTIKNILSSDATLIIIFNNEIGPGTKLTINYVKNNNIKYYIAKHETSSPIKIANWIIKSNIATLNIAGTRDSSKYSMAYEFVKSIISNIKA